MNYESGERRDILKIVMKADKKKRTTKIDPKHKDMCVVGHG